MFDDNSFGRPIRLAYLEARLFLDGEFYSRKLMQFGYTRQSASSDIKTYLAMHPGVMNYCPSRKRFLLDRRYKPKLLRQEQLAPYARYVETVFQMAYKPLAKSVDV